METINFSAEYPRNVIVNFSKLDAASLRRILSHYTAKHNLSDDLSKKTHEELSAAVARLFEAKRVAESNVIDTFAAVYCQSHSDRSIENAHTESAANKRKRDQEFANSRSRLDSEPAKLGEQVAAKVSSSNENGSWILGNVVDYDPQRDLYEIQDEDDVSRTMNLTSSEVRRLDESTAHFRKGDEVLCVFPETTSFYRATVAKNPKIPAHGNAASELIVRSLAELPIQALPALITSHIRRFEDDDDDTGHAPPRRIPGRFVLRRSDVEEYEDDDDEND